MFQITHDHTMVQSLVDEGRLSPAEAVSHPERALLVRALGQGARSKPDMRLHDARKNSSPWPTEWAAPTTSAVWSPTSWSVSGRSERRGAGSRR